MSIEELSNNENKLSRLLEALEAKGFKKHGRVSKLAALTKYAIGQVSDLLSGKVSLNDRFLNSVCEAVGISYEWVQTGEGEMFVVPESRPHTYSDQLKGFSPEIKLLADYLEVKLRGKTAEERLKYVEEVMEEIRRKNK